MSKSSFVKNPEEAIFAYSVLRGLGCGEMSTFNERIKSQKVQYLAQLFGISPKYQYNLYLHGPYSPALANDLFKISEDKVSVIKIKFVSDELENKFLNLKKFMATIRSRKELELITTLHWLSKVAKLPENEAEKQLIKLKSASEEEAIYVKKLLKLLPE